MNDTDRITETELKQLAQTRGDHCLSLLMPTHRAGRAIRQDPIRLKNLIRQARDQLVDRGEPDKTADSLLKPVSALLDDRDFWKHQGDGLALYLDAEDVRRYRTGVSLPEVVVVQDRFYIVALLPQVTQNSRFFLLAFSPNRVRLLEGDRSEIHERQIPELPKDFGELGKYIDSEKQLQFHTEAAPQGGGGRAAMFHGHGGGGADASERKQRLIEFSRIVDAAWQQGLPEKPDGKVPLLLACDKSLAPLYCEANSYAGLLEPVLAGNPDELRSEELHEKAWSVLSAELSARRQELVGAFHEAEAAGKGTCDLAEIIPAAAQGKVAKLLLAEGARQWGQFDVQQQTVELADSDRDAGQELVNLAASEALLTGAEIQVLDSHDTPSPWAAVLRY
jgi:hypothetical protein